MAAAPLLEIDDLHVTVDGSEILRGLSLTVADGEVHALMGPNGSGKSTLANTLLANPAYKVTGGAIRFRGEDVTALPTDERAARGIFLGFQHPEEISGVSVLNFLRQAMAVRKGIPDLSVLEVRLSLMEWTKRLGMDDRFQERYLNEGFSGGEKKRNEILQMAMMEPDVAILDETDSGLDIDALRLVADGIAEVRSDAPAARHPPDHALPAHPRPPHPRRRCTCCSTAASSPPAAPSSRAASRPRASTRSRTRSRASATRVDSPLDVARIKADFPILKRQVHGKRLVYLDSAATSQKPLAVLDAMDRYYREYNANVHRGVYTIAEEATAAFEAARGQGRAASSTPPHPHEIVYVRNATEAINLVAYSWARANLREGDAIVLTHMEHHANIVPWQILAAERGVELRWIPLTADYRLDLSDLDRAARRRQAARGQRDVERARHDQRHPPARRRRPRRRRARAGRRVPGRAAPRGRRAGLGRRLRGVLRPQDVRPHRHRRALGPRASCSRPCRRSWAAAR